jgi:hypothetical protein
MATNPFAADVLQRCIATYPVRMGYKPGRITPPHIKLKDAIDIHCHALPWQQDTMALAKHASRAEMFGVVFKSIDGADEAARAREIQEELNRWADAERVRPIRVWAGHITGHLWKPISAEGVRTAIERGCAMIWLPVFWHANTFHKVGAERKIIYPDSDSMEWTGPISWEEALRQGQYNLDERGNLKQEVKQIIRICHDTGTPLCLGHATHLEIDRLAEEIDRVGFRQGFLDHPFSPFVDLTAQQMQTLSRVGLSFNFTYDEISPVMGINPLELYAAIRSVGVEHFTLSSDAGDALFPDSVEAMRELRAYMGACGLNEDELHTVCSRNPARLLGVEL